MFEAFASNAEGRVFETHARRQLRIYIYSTIAKRSAIYGPLGWDHEKPRSRATVDLTHKRKFTVKCPWRTSMYRSKNGDVSMWVKQSFERDDIQQTFNLHWPFNGKHIHLDTFKQTLIPPLLNSGVMDVRNLVKVHVHYVLYQNLKKLWKKIISFSLHNPWTRMSFNNFIILNFTSLHVHLICLLGALDRVKIDS